MALIVSLPTALAAEPAPLRVSLCGSNVIFVRRTDGGFLERHSEGYEVEIGRVSTGDPGRRTVPASLAEEELPTFLRAVLPEPLEGGVDYRVLVRERNGGEEIGAVEISTKPMARLQPSGALEEAGTTFEILSTTPLAPGGNGLKLLEVLRPPLIDGRGVWREERTRMHPVTIRTGPSNDGPDCQAPTLSGGPEGIWSDSRVVDLHPGDRLSNGSRSVRLLGLRDVFGQEIGVQGRTAPARTPKGKEDALLYGRIFFDSARGRGSADALSLDLKAQPLAGRIGPWLVRPELTVAVSRKAPPATDSIRLAGLLSRTRVARGELLTYQTWSLGPSVETDRGFDRVNALADLRWQPGFRGTYRSREAQRIVLASRLNRAVEEVALPRSGYGIDLRIGAELGVRMRAGEGRSEIARLRPLVTAFYELGLPLDWQLTGNVSSTLRYLVCAEPVAGSSRGFKPYTEAALSLAFDPAQHVALALTYKEGSEPPLFVKIERYSAGVVLKY